ncbi:hypothetical protein CMI48_02695 [Candidatus Pacearchaeota archaeon]|nr:hypothetical protein [Candidatus Pacearchaeota archaeon]
MQAISYLEEHYKQYRWFLTSTKKICIGGKSATQNDELLKRLKRDFNDHDFIIMHTAEPGSPFSAILADPSKIKAQELKEQACFTGSFSRAWRDQKKTLQVDQFMLSQCYKTGAMKTGTWSVKGTRKNHSIRPELVLTRQLEVLRAVPEKTITAKKDKLLILKPGVNDKQDMLAKIQLELPKEKLDQNELLAALPPGGVSVKAP